MKRWLAVIAWVGLVVVAFLVTNYRPRGPLAVVGFGATISQCEKSFGAVGSVIAPTEVLVSPQTRGYDAGGNWFVVVGFDERGLAEEFIYSGDSFFPYQLKPVPLSTAEQQTLLDKFKGTYTWNFAADGKAFGSRWLRSDGQAHAAYITSRRYMVIMNQQCMLRTMRKLNINVQ